MARVGLCAFADPERLYMAPLHSPQMRALKGHEGVIVEAAGTGRSTLIGSEWLQSLGFPAQKKVHKHTGHYLLYVPPDSRCCHVQACNFLRV